MKRLSFLLATLVACAGPQQEESIKPVPSLPAPPPKAATPRSSDVSFELPVTEIKGATFEPEAMGKLTTAGYTGRPIMPLYDPKKKTTLEKQRALVQSTKDPVQKQAQAAVLATMLYRESRTNKANEKALLTEARQVLRDVVQQAGDKAVDEVTLWLLGSYELEFDDYAAAEKAWQALLDKDPKNKNVPFSKDVIFNPAWLVYTLLKQSKNTEALALVSSYKFDDSRPDLAYLAYVAAWAKWRTGDNPGAWQAIVTAAKGWGQNSNHDDLEQDLLLFAGRTNVPLDEAAGTVMTVLGKTKAQQAEQPKQKAEQLKQQAEQLKHQYELLAKLGIVGYGLVGRWSDAVAALEKSLTLAGDTVPPSERPFIRYRQTEFTVPLDTPDVAATYAKQAIDALGACGAKCTDKEKADLVQSVYFTAQLFHNLYATANDRRYYQPAHDLYALTIPLLGEPARTQAQKIAANLETTLKNTKVGTGTHDKGVIGALLVRHSAEIQACYEAGLVLNPKLGGTIVLNLESDASGVIKGATTEPKAGLADLSAVAGCVIDHAKQWKLPKRGMAGNTRIKMSYTFSVKK